MTICQICKEARIQNGITQKEVARELNYTQSVISDFERGKNNNLTIFLYYLQKILNSDDVYYIVCSGDFEWSDNK